MASLSISTGLTACPTTTSPPLRRIPAKFECARSELASTAGFSTHGRDSPACGASTSPDCQLNWANSWTGAYGIRRTGRDAAAHGISRARVSSPGRLVVCAAALEGGEEIKSRGLALDGPGKGGQWLSSTTRHARIYIGVVDPETAAMDQQQLDKVTLMLDPDDEFIWPPDKLQKVYDYFTELVDNYAGAPCTEYTLRLIGSDIEHYIRKLLLANEIKYNLDCRVLNFSMGKPYYKPEYIEASEES